LFVALLLVLGGLVLSIPWGIGDVLGGLFFFLALFGGVALAVLLVGFAAGGSLLWPTVAVEGTTSFDAFSTSFHYIYSRPWRTALYGIVALLYGGICWLVVSFFAHLVLWVTHACVGAGTLVADRTVNGQTVSKLDTLWSLKRLMGSAHEGILPTVSGVEYFSAGLIGFWVYLVMAIVWAVLLSYYFCGSTVIYFLLRRAIDLTDYERVEGIEDFEYDEPGTDTIEPSSGTVEPAPETAATETGPPEPPPAPEPPPESGPTGPSSDEDEDR
jgi:hypothetical protein